MLISEMKAENDNRKLRNVKKKYFIWKWNMSCSVARHVCIFAFVQYTLKTRVLSVFVTFIVALVYII